MQSDPGSPLTVVKYGGASLGSRESVARVIAELRTASRPRVVVVSAREGVTDLLKSCVNEPTSVGRHASAVATIASLHPGLPREAHAQVRALEGTLSMLRRSASGRSRSRRGSSTTPFQASLSTSDAILSVGERLAAHWLSAKLQEAGISAQALEADRIGLRTDARHGDAAVLLEASERAVRRAILPVLRKGALPIVTGFLGRAPSGRVTTLGRGGSDYSATSLGYLLGAARVELVKKDVSILTADPRLVPQARPLSRLSYEEAEELAQFGAKVLHPMTVEPARARGIEVRIRSLEDPNRLTSIGPALPGEGIRALTLLAPAAMLLLRVPGGRQKKGVIAEVSRSLSRADVNVITLFTSSALLIVLVENAAGRKARRTLEAFARADGASLEGPLPAALVTAIGEGVLADLGGLPSEVSSRAIGVSATSRTLSFAVPEPRGKEALVHLHRVLVEQRQLPPLAGVHAHLARP